MSFVLPAVISFKDLLKRNLANFLGFTMSIGIQNVFFFELACKRLQPMPDRK